MKSYKTFSVLLATVGLVAVVSYASTPTQVGTGGYIGDSVITAKVKTAIINDENLKVLDINVVTQKGVVQLSGFVNSEIAEQHAVELSSRVEGVKSVQDDMRIK